MAATEYGVSTWPGAPRRSKRRVVVLSRLFRGARAAVPRTQRSHAHDPGWRHANDIPSDKPKELNYQFAITRQTQIKTNGYFFIVIYKYNITPTPTNIAIRMLRFYSAWV